MEEASQGSWRGRTRSSRMEEESGDSTAGSRASTSSTLTWDTASLASEATPVTDSGSDTVSGQRATDLSQKKFKERKGYKSERAAAQEERQRARAERLSAAPPAPVPSTLPPTVVANRSDGQPTLEAVPRAAPLTPVQRLPETTPAVAPPIRVAAASRMFTGSVIGFSGDLLEGIVHNGVEPGGWEVGARGLALATAGALVGGSHLNRLAETDYDPASTSLLEAAPRRGDRVYTRTTVDHDTTAQRQLNAPRTEGGARERVPTATRRTTTGTGTLLTSAAKLATRMAGRPEAAQSIRGFFAAASANPVFGTAVARALLSRLDQVAYARQLASAPEAEALCAAVRLWASRSDSNLQEGREGDGEREASPSRVTAELRALQGLPGREALALADEQQSGVNRVGLAVVAIVQNKPLASRCLQARVCVVCLAAHLSGEDYPETVEGESGELPSFEEIRRTLLGTNSGRAAAMAALAHNREMHASNGNIHFTANLAETRVDVMMRIRAEADRGDRYRWRPSQQMEDALCESENQLSGIQVQSSHF